MKVKEILTKPKTGKELCTELKKTGFIRKWKNRTDTENNLKFSRNLRERSQKR